MILENEFVRLRALEPEDVELLYLWENDPDTWRVSDTLAPYSRFNLEKYIFSENDIYANRQLRLMITAKNAGAVGTIDMFDFNPTHERAGVGLLVYSKSHRRKGYATQALQLVSEYASDILHLHLLYCNVAARNIESIECMRKAGFAECGRKTEWNRTAEGREDEIMFQKILLR
ncbi:MAG: GNAT family N-acetyltransferase [Prevotellaceae bacterium]|jgi:diamine N-acetyltransferase|nr:GNAT family N-acetyltransferase [Prevotellaceae bacterium]